MINKFIFLPLTSDCLTYCEELKTKITTLKNVYADIQIDTQYLLPLHDRIKYGYEIIIISKDNVDNHTVSRIYEWKQTNTTKLVNYRLINYRRFYFIFLCQILLYVAIYEHRDDGSLVLV